MDERNREERSFRQVSQARDDFAQIMDQIRFVQEQTPNCSTRADVWRTALSVAVGKWSRPQSFSQWPFMRLGRRLGD
jgi:hypothetical protein